MGTSPPPVPPRPARSPFLLRLAMACCFLLLGLAIGVGLPRNTGTKVRYSEVRGLDAGGMSLVTPLHYLEGGRSKTRSWIQRQRPSLGPVIETARDSCVRVHGPADESGDLALATGVIVEGGRWVLTAGHAFAYPVGTEVRVILTSGQTVTGTLRASVNRTGDAPTDTTGVPESAARDGALEDWAWIELGEPLPAELALPVAPAVAPEGLVFWLGYPDGMGVGTSDHVVIGDTHNPRLLLPLAGIGFRRSGDGMIVDPVSGSLPIGGCSGGPVCNEKGELVGICSSVSATQEASGPRYRVHCMDITRIEPAGS